jgi:hypothetical protein
MQRLDLLGALKIPELRGFTRREACAEVVGTRGAIRQQYRPAPEEFGK